MPTTFKTDKATGKTVISSDNQVQSAAQGGDNQFEYRQDAANLGLRPGRERMLNVISSQQPVQPGYMNFNEFKAVSGMTKTNPYGNDGFFSRVLGIDPSNIDYTSNLGPQGIENVSRIAYDRFLNPFAKVSSVTGRPVGGDAATGTPRYGISPGEQTIAGIAREVPRTGLDALVSGIPFIGGIDRMFGDRPTRITPMEDYEQQQQALGMGANLYGKPGSSISSMIEGAKQFFQAGQDQTAPVENTRMAFDPKFGDTVYGSDALTPYTYFDGPAETGSGVPMDREAQGATYRSPDGRMFRDQFEAIESVGIDNINNPIITDIITKPGPGGDLLRQAQQFGSVGQ